MTYDDVIRESKKKGGKDRDSTKKAILYNGQIRRVIMTIADGIAWRLLNFDRPFIAKLGENKRTGVQLNSEDNLKTLERVRYWVKEYNSKVLLTDITHYITVGDVIDITNDQTMVSEMKQSGKRIINAYTLSKQHPNSKVSSQGKRVLNAQYVKDGRKMTIEKDNKILSLPIWDIPIKLDNYFKNVNHLINRARVKGFSTHKYKHLEIKCINLDTLKNLNENELISDDEYKNVFKQLNSEFTDSFTLSNLDSFYVYGKEFPYGLTPYSIYPLNKDNSFDLMTGNTLLISHINLEEIKNIFRKNGWTVSDKSMAGNKPGSLIDKLESEGMLEEMPHSIFFYINKDRFNIGVPFQVIKMLGMDFMTTSTLIKYYEYIKNNSTPDVDDVIVPFIKGEQEVWK